MLYILEPESNVDSMFTAAWPWRGWLDRVSLQAPTCEIKAPYGIQAPHGIQAPYGAQAPYGIIGFFAKEFGLWIISSGMFEVCDATAVLGT